MEILKFRKITKQRDEDKLHLNELGGGRKSWIEEFHLQPWRLMVDTVQLQNDIDQGIR